MEAQLCACCLTWVLNLDQPGCMGTGEPQEQHTTPLLPLRHCPLTVGHGETMLDFCNFSLVGTDYRPRQEMTRATFFSTMG